MIYLDNAATSWPKPDSVVEGVANSMRLYGANPGRSGHEMAIKSMEKVYECRELIAHFFGIDNPENIIFTQNATMALNFAINGILKEGDHAICTQMDHNSVIRPLYALVPKIDLSIAKADADGYVSVSSVESLIKPNTRLVIMPHVSNVCGTIMPIEDVAKLCRQKGILFLVDASQSAGIIDIDMNTLGIDFLAAPGHKSLCGPMGTGVLIINTNEDIKPIISGGTGSYSKVLSQPLNFPDRLESGTLNLPGICGLVEGVRYINDIGIQNILNHELMLASYLIDGLKSLKDTRVVGRKNISGRTGVVSFTHSHKDSVSVAQHLNDSYSIATRAMYHCAYSSHVALGTAEFGTVRVSPGIFNTISEIEILLYSLSKL